MTAVADIIFYLIREAPENFYSPEEQSAPLFYFLVLEPLWNDDVFLVIKCLPGFGELPHNALRFFTVKANFQTDIL
jgi:hypothetical protein